MDTTNPLLGHWSTEYGHYSVMEDEALVFRADGTGWYEYARPFYSHFHLFRWEPIAADRIRVTTYQEIERNDWKGRKRSRPDRRDVHSVEEVDYRIGSTARPLLPQPVAELTIALSLCTGARFGYVGPQVAVPDDLSGSIQT